MNENIKLQINHEMENYFKGDTRYINHAHKVTEYAEEIGSKEGGDFPVVVAAGLLHDIGIPEAERKYGSAIGKYQEIEGPPIAREILSRIRFPGKQIDEVCEIIAHHHSPGIIKSQNFKILYDADWLVNLGDEYDIKDNNKLKTIIGKVFLTSSGQSLARKIYLGIQ
jgi:HD superfamily phosphodiesterase